MIFTMEFFMEILHTPNITRYLIIIQRKMQIDEFIFRCSYAFSKIAKFSYDLN